MKQLRFIAIVLLALFGLAIGALFTLPSKPREFVKIEINGASLIAEVAADPVSRSGGLSGRERLAPNQGILFVFDKPGRHGVRMTGMKFPIDILWIKNGSVADIEEMVRFSSGPGDNFVSVYPNTGRGVRVYRPDVPAEMILETVAGFAGSRGIKIGDPVRIGFGARALAAAAASSVSRSESSATGDQKPLAGEEYFIENIRQNPPRGRNFKIRKVLETNSAYQKFLISYESDGLTLTGVMNVPFGPVAEGGFPVLILNHGLIRPSIYYSGRGSKREQDFFARRGYATLHPDYRGYAGSGSNPTAHHDFYVGYTRDVLGLIDALKRQEQKIMDLGRIGMWGHSLGGGIAARVAVLSPDIRAYVLFAPISADAEDNFYELTAKEVKRLYQIYGPAGAEVYKKMSPLEYFADVRAPVQMHHGIADKDVPVSFSKKMFEALAKLDKKAELFTYPGEGHEFAGAWTLAAERSVQFFDKYVKNAL